MPQRTTTPADPTRSDVGLTFFSTWHVGTPERQRATVDAIAHAWESRVWPHEGLLSYNVYTGSDGQTLMHHSQWRDDEAYQDFFANGRDQRNAEIDAAVPGIERLGLTKTRHYRTVAGGGTGTPEAFVTVEVDFEGPDAERQRAWVDTVATALASDPVPAPGLVAAHFHLSTDGRRMVNYAEWQSQQAHIDALAAPGDGVGSPSPQWQKVREFPGVVQDSKVKRYRFAYGVAPR
ncbi:antibiotic biosynthesis monooxygenase [Streptomyces sp. NPDC059063]|uniref:antibiotic biosynthesis monooxygenase n=1 Tax=unclassified Streptomyces TaxID=2593676 RepID=UPI0036BEB00A